MPSLWERFMAWLCVKLGHRPRIHYNSPGGGGPEICTRCNRLLSTTYSRERTLTAKPGAEGV